MLFLMAWFIQSRSVSSAQSAVKVTVFRVRCHLHLLAPGCTNLQKKNLRNFHPPHFRDLSGPNGSYRDHKNVKTGCPRPIWVSERSRPPVSASACIDFRETIRPRRHVDAGIAAVFGVPRSGHRPGPTPACRFDQGRFGAGGGKYGMLGHGRSRVAKLLCKTRVLAAVVLVGNAPGRPGLVLLPRITIDVARTSPGYFDAGGAGSNCASVGASGSQWSPGRAVEHRCAVVSFAAAGLLDAAAARGF